MTSEELLKPRYKVIGDYPGSHLKVGKIVNIDYGKTTYDAPNDYDKYPAIFRKIAWWEERTLEEMPEYVKIIETPYKDKVLHLPDYEKGSHIYEIQLDMPEMFMLHLVYTTPVEESDYCSYLKTE